jgi:hypothetical protein
MIRSVAASPRGVTTFALALGLAGCAARPPVTTRSLLRDGRLYEACHFPWYDDRAAILAETQRLAPPRVRVHIAADPTDPEFVALAVPTPRFGRFGAMTVELPSAPPGGPRIGVSIEAPQFVAAPRLEPSGAALVSTLDVTLARWMLTGQRPVTADASLPLLGALADAVMAFSTFGAVDTHLRDRAAAGTPTTSPVPPAEQAAADALLARFARSDNSRASCGAIAGGRCTQLLALLPASGTAEATHLKFYVSWWIAGAPGEEVCDQRREVYLALPPGADLGARINAAFARGPVDLAALPDIAR